ncbi:MAG: response regulator [Magnetovibrionaceae bacterium]
MPAAQSLRVLIVDDQASMRGLTRYCLEQMGVRNVTEANDGAAALNEMKLNKFDLIISDWNMEGIDGLELLKTIRANPLTQKTPFIMSTGNKEREKVQTAIKAGVNNYVVKPFNVATLKKKMEAVVGQLT